MGEVYPLRTTRAPRCAPLAPLAFLIAGALAAPALTARAAEGDGPLPPASLPEPVPAGTAAPPLPPVPPAPLLEAPPLRASDVGLLESTSFDAWLDVPHAFIERRVFAVVNGFDRFFADERTLDCDRPGSFLRWRNELHVGETGRTDFATSVRADLHLPYLEQRLKDFRILLENAGQAALDGEPRALTGQEDGGRGDAVLRMTLLETLRSSFDLGGGILFDLPPGLVGRVRFRQSIDLGRVALARFAAVGFWNTHDGFGSTASLAFERPLTKGLLLRWTSGALISQRSSGSSGYEGASELALLASLGKKVGLTLLGSGSAHTKPEPVVQTWRVAARLRTVLYRRWIYGELEPEVTWPLDPAGGRRATPAVIFRIEVQFEDPSKSAVAGPGACGLASGNEPSKGGA